MWFPYLGAWHYYILAQKKIQLLSMVWPSWKTLLYRDRDAINWNSKALSFNWLHAKGSNLEALGLLLEAVWNNPNSIWALYELVDEDWNKG